MRRMVVVLGLLSWLAEARAVQDDDLVTLDVTSIEERPGFLTAVRQIVEGEAAKGAQQLAKLRERHPDEPDLYILDYNLACAHARLGELPQAIEHLRRAVAGGYGQVGGQIKTLERDPDLAAVRESEAWPALFEQARAAAEAVKQSPEPFVWSPPAPERPEAAPEDWEAPAPGILLCLHPHGARPEVFARRFQELCRERNLILFAPYGPSVVSAGRWTWAFDPIDFLGTYSLSNRVIWQQLMKVRRTHRHDASRIFAVGSGQGGSMAFAIASRNPQWCRGAVVFGAPLAPSILDQWLRPAIHFGRRVAVVRAAQEEAIPGDRLQAYVELCVSKGLDYRIVDHPGAGGMPEDGAQVCAKALDWIEDKPLVTERCPQELMLEPGEGPRLPELDPTKDDGEEEGS